MITLEGYNFGPNFLSQIYIYVLMCAKLINTHTSVNKQHTFEDSVVHISVGSSFLVLQLVLNKAFHNQHSTVQLLSSQCYNFGTFNVMSFEMLGTFTVDLL